MSSGVSGMTGIGREKRSGRVRLKVTDNARSLLGSARAGAVPEATVEVANGVPDAGILRDRQKDDDGRDQEVPSSSSATFIGGVHGTSPRS